MKCISIWQPWASLLFSPEPFRKEFETRGRRKNSNLPTIVIPDGETIAIQAAKTLDGFRCLDQIPRRDRELMERSLRAQFPDREPGTLWENVLPFMAIIGTVKIVRTLAVEDIDDVLPEQERAFGDFRPGRFAIATAEPRRFRMPIECRGEQGVFRVKDCVIAEAV